MTREDYEELKRLRGKYGCVKIRKQAEYLLMAESKDSYVFAELDHRLVKVGNPLDIATAIAAYEREHKEDK